MTKSLMIHLIHHLPYLITVTAVLLASYATGHAIIPMARISDPHGSGRSMMGTVYSSRGANANSLTPLVVSPAARFGTHPVDLTEDNSLGDDVSLRVAKISRPKTRGMHGIHIAIRRKRQSAAVKNLYKQYATAESKPRQETRKRQEWSDPGEPANSRKASSTDFAHETVSAQRSPSLIGLFQTGFKMVNDVFRNSVLVGSHVMGNLISVPLDTLSAGLVLTGSLVAPRN